MGRGIDQPLNLGNQSLLPRHVERLVVIQWVDGAPNLVVVCELLEPGGRPGPHLTGMVMLLLAGLAGPGLAPAAFWLWVIGGDWFCVCVWLRSWLWVWFWVWGVGQKSPRSSLPMSDSTLRLAPGATNSAMMPS